MTLAVGFTACGGSSLKAPAGRADGGNGADAGGGGDAADSREIGTLPIAGRDPGRVSIHRLNSLEYDNTVRDLLGLDAHARATFISDEQGTFDNDADAFTMNDARYEQYFDSADALAEAAAADVNVWARVVTCAPASATDTTCAAQIVRTFGLRAWRRPLTDDEVSRLVAFIQRAMAAGETFDGAIKDTVKALLSSISFLYRIEYDLDASSLVPHAVSPYELASRLSYWLWSTMPDDQLFALAGSGALAEPATLSAQVDRLLADGRSEAFVESFAGQWLLGREVGTRETRLPAVDDELRAAMQTEIYLYFTEFLRGDRPFDQFLTADVNFVNERLARHYGMDTTGLGAAPVRVEDTHDARKGFLGLAGSLFALAYADYTWPSWRGRWIDLDLFCDTSLSIPLDADHDGSSLTQPPPESAAFRQLLEGIGATAACAACHDRFDPAGLGLEEFDTLGQLRTSYANGDPIQTDGVLADGKKFADALQLADALAGDPRLLDCATSKSLTYALGRDLVLTDQPYLADLRGAWSQQGLTLRALLELIVLDDTFRFRRGEAATP